ncbi:uncharacterized protein LOC118752274 [Rhagoletis pomonella]|uniref:uncharacterized protein LOC118752188 n=1 Tax=Rhagoletis pomonella TaxID=28610 RepID=UPI0017843235|nr:uncharacterized protein LOC118752188 [Rhagoletis pomonella]XP_036343034.1 uncharacterized protein LOC118752274 [Rhagoletis pomonella]
MVGGRQIRNATSKTNVSPEGGWITVSNLTTTVEPNKKSLVVICHGLNMQLTENVVSTHTVNILYQRCAIVDGLTEHLELKREINTAADLEANRASALDAIERSQEYASKHFAERRKPLEIYSEGDFLVIRNTDTVIGTNKKLIPKYRGLYVIHKVLPHDLYVIRDVENCQLTELPYDGVVEAARLKRWVTWT